MCLPKNGSGLCNPIHVNDLCKAINTVITKKSNSGFKEYIITSNITLSWKRVYEIAKNYLINSNIQCGNIVFDKSDNFFHTKYHINLIYHILYTRLGSLIYRFYLFLKSYKKIKTSSQSIRFDSRNVYKPSGIYRLLYSTMQTYKSDLFFNETNFKPTFDEVKKIEENFF